MLCRKRLTDAYRVPAQNMSRFSMTFSRFPDWKRRNSLTFARVKYHNKFKWLAISLLHFKNINWTRLNARLNGLTLCFHFNLKWLRINWGDSIRFGMTWKDWGKKNYMWDNCVLILLRSIDSCSKSFEFFHSVNFCFFFISFNSSTNNFLFLSSLE